MYTGDRACPFAGGFRPLIGECSGWAGRRNDVAHGRAAQMLNGWHLFPGLYNTNRQPLGAVPAYAYTSAQIANFGIAFEGLYDRLSEYATSIDGWLYTLLQNTLAQESQPSTSLDP
jgi:hypothetical protein